MAKAVVIFWDDGNHWACRFLKPGFRHVSVAVLDDRGYWIYINPHVGTPDFGVVAGKDFDIATFYRAQGFTVVETMTQRTEPRTPWMLSNCVAIVKVILGLRAPFVFTPYALFKRLTP